jgi:plasmid stabilization system protein ParE
MRLALHCSADFHRDFDQQYRWYLERAGETLAERYFRAVLATLHLLMRQPDMGRERNFPHPMLRGIRSFRLVAPFQVHVIFYRHTSSELFAERLMHGARDMSRRLLEPSSD